MELRKNKIAVDVENSADLITAYHYEKHLRPAMKRRDINVEKMHKRLGYVKRRFRHSNGKGFYTKMCPPPKPEKKWYNDTARPLSNTTWAECKIRDETGRYKEEGYEFAWNPIYCMAVSSFMWTYTIPLFLLIIMSERWFYGG